MPGEANLWTLVKATSSPPTKEVKVSGYRQMERQETRNQGVKMASRAVVKIG